MNKKTVSVTVDTFSPCRFTGDLAELSNKINQWVKEYGSTAAIDYSGSGFDPYSDYPGFCITVDRLETDEEFATRCAYEAARSKEQHAYNLAEFKRLSAIFNKPV